MPSLCETPGAFWGYTKHVEAERWSAERSAPGYPASLEGIIMDITYFTQRPTDLAYYMAKSRLDNRRKFRVIIAVADDKGRTLELTDEVVSLKALAKVRTSKPRVVIQPNNALANTIHPHVWTVVLQQDDTIAVRTVPFLAPKVAK